MSRDKPFVRASLLAGSIIVMIAGVLSLTHRGSFVLGGTGATVPQEPNTPFFSPEVNLELEDITILESAREWVDVAMYSFTDTRVVTALKSAANRGVKVRIYRDELQFADEEARAARRGQKSAMDELKGVPRIEIKIKGRGVSMHLKTYCVDGRVLRTGSANWSFQGETEQDNDMYLVHSRETISTFEKEFSSLWERPDNKLP